MKPRWGLNPGYFAGRDCGLYLKTLEQIKNLGFDGILGLGSLSPTKPKSTLTFLDIKRGLRDTGLRFFQFHADWMNIASPDGSERREAIEFYKRWIGYALEVEAEQLVIHLGAAYHLEPPEERQEAIELAAESLRTLVKEIKGTTLKIALENEGIGPPDSELRYEGAIPESQLDPERMFGANPKEIASVVERAEVWEHIGICLDTGHAIAAKQDLEDAILGAGRHIIGTHLHDTFTSYGYELHLPPGEGTIDWKMVVDRLRQVGYTGPYTFELAHKDASWEEKVRRVKKSKELLEGLLITDINRQPKAEH
ncbi:MAG: sugar phosphate isomerase/epimerase [Candidatus Latescibacteria bacterium]|nr:sugar phosphate isomerase/epimerase [Candidatus Latescibacterota bacterium]